MSELTLITIQSWKNSGWTNNVIISYDPDNVRFVFQGRASEWLSRHVPFPIDNDYIYFDGKEELTAFIKRSLPFWGCPDDLIKQLMHEINNFKIS